MSFWAGRSGVVLMEMVMITESAEESSGDSIDTNILSLPRASFSPDRCPINILVIQIPRRRFSDGNEPLRTVRRHPDAITGCDGIPGIVQAINAQTLEH